MGQFWDPTSACRCFWKHRKPFKKNLSNSLVLELDHPTHIQSVASSSLGRNRQQSPFCCRLGLAGLGFLANSNVRFQKSQKISKAVPRYQVQKNSAQIIRMSTLNVREGRSPSQSCLHFAYLGGSSNEHQMTPGSLLGPPAISPHFDGPPMGRDKIDQGHPGPPPDVRPRYHRLETPSVWGFISQGPQGPQGPQVFVRVRLLGCSHLPAGGEIGCVGCQKHWEDPKMIQICCDGMQV